MVKGFIIANLKDINEVLSLTKIHVKKIDNWSLCDSFCAELKIVKKHDDLVFDFISKYFNSSNTYEVRFAIVLILFHYINDKYIDRLFDIFDSINCDEYYVMMSVAWAVSMCFVKYPDKTMKYLKKNKLDNVTYNKSLQKTIESYRVDKEVKDILRGMKRK